MTQFILLTSAQEAIFDGPTGPSAALDPRLVDAGTYAGQYVLPIAVLSDPAHQTKWAVLSTKPQADIDPMIAWPVIP